MQGTIFVPVIMPVWGPIHRAVEAWSGFPWTRANRVAALVGVLWPIVKGHQTLLFMSISHPSQLCS